MRFLDALGKKNQGRPPVWFMRQAGRYLPEYRLLREKHSLRDLFFTPSLAAEVTMMPIRRFGFDAAILFSDITAIAPAMGYSLDFCEGPLIQPLAKATHWEALREDLSLLDPIAEAAALVKQQLEVPLIGFCGGPFTIATYLIEQHDGVGLPQTYSWMQNDPIGFAKFLDRICDVCIHSLNLQIQAGADAVQIFDSWANALDEAQFATFSLPFLRKIARSVKCPTILFMRGSALRAEQLAEIENAAISLDMGRKVSEVRQFVSAPLQGNLDPDLLFQPLEDIKRAVRSLLQEMHSDPGFIVNLGHGIKPGTPLEAVSAVLETIHKSY